LSAEQIKQIGDGLIENQVKDISLEVSDQFGMQLRNEEFDNPTAQDLAQFFNGSSQYKAIEKPDEENNPAVLYNELKQEALAMGMKYSEAAKWAKDQILKNTEEPASYPA